jgi:hypothetical protein
MIYQFNNISSEKVIQAEKAIKENGGEVYVGDKFSIMGVKGKYTLIGSTLTVDITDKPWLASWNMIEEKLKGFFR